MVVFSICVDLSHNSKSKSKKNVLISLEDVDTLLLYKEYKNCVL